VIRSNRTIEIYVYRTGGEWFGARWIDGEYDGCDELPCDGEVSWDDALACAETMPLVVDGERVVRLRPGSRSEY
jgi:hypothetical protein